MTNHTRCSYFDRLLVIAVMCSTVASEDYFASSYNDDTESDGTHPDATSSSACVLVYALIFSFFTSLIGVVIGYFSFMEDSLMREYIKNGDLIKGDVMSIEYTRGGGQVGSCSNQRAIAEYVAFVEYSRKLKDDYPVRIRKQMKAKETDFAKPIVPGSTAMLENLRDRANGDDNIRDVIEECDGYVDIGPVHRFGTLGCPDAIELYVLPEFPTSALPRRHVERSCGIRYRISTFALIVVDLALAAFCNLFAADAIVELTGIGQESINLYAISMSVILILTQVFLVHICLRRLFWNVLVEEYLATGDYVTIQRDDSSWSSGGSDAFLSSDSFGKMESTSSIQSMR